METASCYAHNHRIAFQSRSVNLFPQRMGGLASCWDGKNEAEDEKAGKEKAAGGKKKQKIQKNSFAKNRRMKGTR